MMHMHIPHETCTCTCAFHMKPAPRTGRLPSHRLLEHKTLMHGAESVDFRFGTQGSVTAIGAAARQAIVAQRVATLPANTTRELRMLVTYLGHITPRRLRALPLAQLHELARYLAPANSASAASAASAAARADANPRRSRRQLEALVLRLKVDHAKVHGHVHGHGLCMCMAMCCASRQTTRRSWPCPWAWPCACAWACAVPQGRPLEGAWPCACAWPMHVHSRAGRQSPRADEPTSRACLMPRCMPRHAI